MSHISHINSEFVAEFLPGDVRIGREADERAPLHPAALARRQVRLRVGAAERHRHRLQGRRQLALGGQGADRQEVLQ